jgi:hypothetical protein
MKRNTTVFLQLVLVLAGLAVLAFLLREPWFEGVNADAAGFADVYLDDPFLAYAYLASVPFFLGLWQAFKMLGYARREKLFSEAGVKAARTIRNCALVTAAAVIGGGAYAGINAAGSGDDAAGFMMLSLLATLASLAAGAAAALAAELLRTGAAHKLPA